MPYYRHQTEEIIYHVPDNPHVAMRPYKGREYKWVVSESIEIIHGDNPLDENGHLTKPENESGNVEMEAKYTEQEARNKYFTRNTPADCDEITAAEYVELRREWRARQVRQPN